MASLERCLKVKTCVLGFVCSKMRDSRWHGRHINHRYLRKRDGNHAECACLMCVRVPHGTFKVRYET